MNCEEYILFVTEKIQNKIIHYETVQSRGLNYLTSYAAEKKIEVLVELAEELGVELE